MKHTDTTQSKAATEAANRRLAIDGELSSAVAFGSGEEPIMDDFDPYTAKRKYGREAKKTKRETMAERDARLDAEQIAADAPIVAALLGLKS